MAPKKARSPARNVRLESPLGLVGLTVVGRKSLPSSGVVAAAPRAASPAQTREKDYRVWNSNCQPASRASSSGLAVVAADSSSVFEISVISGISGDLLASFPDGTSSWTGADVIRRLIENNPLPRGQGYRLVLDDKVIGREDTMSNNGEGPLEIAAFVEISPLLIDCPGVEAAVHKIRALPGHLSHASQHRDWESLDGGDTSQYVFTIEVLCILLGIELKRTGRYGDLASRALPLLDPNALADVVSKARIPGGDAANMLALVDPYLKDRRFSVDAIRAVERSYLSGSIQRVGKTCAALQEWCEEVVKELQHQVSVGCHDGSSACAFWLCSAMMHRNFGVRISTLLHAIILSESTQLECSQHLLL